MRVNERLWFDSLGPLGTQKHKSPIIYLDKRKLSVTCETWNNAIGNSPVWGS